MNRGGFPERARTAAPDPATTLRRRARELARRPADPLRAGELLEVLEFEVATERHAVELGQVREVQRLQALTPLPGTPAFVAGIMPVRGRIVPVYDLGAFLEIPERGRGDPRFVILVRHRELELGCLAGGALHVRALRRSELQAPPATLESRRTGYLAGITADGLVVLDLVRLLADPRILVDHRAEPTPSHDWRNPK